MVGGGCVGGGVVGTGGCGVGDGRWLGGGVGVIGGLGGGGGGGGRWCGCRCVGVCVWDVILLTVQHQQIPEHRYCDFAKRFNDTSSHIISQIHQFCKIAEHDADSQISLARLHRSITPKFVTPTALSYIHDGAVDVTNLGVMLLCQTPQF